jgi:malate permease and related proteins
MSFTNLCLQIIPLYLFLILGYLGKKFLDLDKQQIAKMLIYLLAPWVIFVSIASMSFAKELLFLPIAIFLIATAVSFFSRFLAKMIFTPEESNLIGATCGMLNSGYFGLPIAMLLLPTNFVGVYMLGIIGLTFHESLIGLYLLFRKDSSPIKSIKKLARMPMIWCSLLGIIFSAYNINLPETILNLTDKVKNAYVILGMMMLGTALGEVKIKKLDLKFITFFVLCKSTLWIALCYTFIIIGKSLNLISSTEIEIIFYIIASLPTAANSVAYASILNLHPEKIVTVVLITTLTSLPLLYLYLF